MKKVLALALIAGFGFFTACNSGSDKKEEENHTEEVEKTFDDAKEEMEEVTEEAEEVVDTVATEMEEAAEEMTEDPKDEDHGDSH